MKRVFSVSGQKQASFSVVKKSYKLEIDFATNELRRLQFSKIKKRIIHKSCSLDHIERVDKGDELQIRLIISDGVSKIKRYNFWFESSAERDEFCGLIRAAQRCREEALDAFHQLDEDGNGLISFSEVESVIGRRRSSFLLDDDNEIDFPRFLLVFFQNMSIALEDNNLHHGKKKHFIEKIAIHMIKQDEKIKAPFSTVEMLHGELQNVVQSNTIMSCLQMDIDGIQGEMMLTNFRIIFEAYRKENYELVEIPIFAISKISVNADGLFPNLLLVCKDFRRISLGFDTKPIWVTNLQGILESLTFCEDQTKCFAYAHHFNEEDEKKEGMLIKSGEAQINGWEIYNIQDELARLDLLHDPSFRVIDNSAYNICSTYPQFLVFPRNMTDEEIAITSRYRSRGRLPAIVWKHPKTHATISRCSQPLTGALRKRCKPDELLILRIREINPTNSNVIYFMDARPLKAAVGNTIMGKGFENMSNYEGAQLEFLGIDNIHVIRGCFEKFMNLLYSDEADEQNQSYFSRLEATQWLHYIRIMLQAANRIARILDEEGASVIVHCSDGWDRTSQLTCLSSLILDPFYRTLNGFAILIEKEWLAFGHKFAFRHGHASSEWDDEQRAPIFLQFLDCVYQMQNQFPRLFEFTEDFLIEIYNSLLNCRFGTFLFNSENQRKVDGDVVNRTESLWTYLCSVGKRELYTNPFYDPITSKATYVYPNCHQRHIVVWERFHLRWTKWVRNQSHESRIFQPAMYNRLNASILRKQVQFAKQCNRVMSLRRIENRAVCTLRPIFGDDMVQNEFHILQEFMDTEQILSDPDVDISSHHQILNLELHDTPESKEFEFVNQRYTLSYDENEVIRQLVVPPLEMDLVWTELDYIPPQF